MTRESSNMPFDDVPINRHLALRLLSRSDSEAVVEMDVKPELLQEYGVVHGGILAVVADTAAVYVLHPALTAAQTMTSIEFKVNFLAAARPGGDVLRAHASLIRKGRRVAVCEVRLLQAKTEILRGLFTYLISDPMSG